MSFRYYRQKSYENYLQKITEKSCRAAEFILVSGSEYLVIQRN